MSWLPVLVAYAVSIPISAAVIGGVKLIERRENRRAPLTEEQWRKP